MMHYENLESKLCKELMALDEKYKTATELSEADLRKIDMITHAMKCLATYIAMAEAKEMNQYNNNSYARMGRYMSRDGVPMNQGYGHSGDYFPYRPAEYPEMRNW